MLSSPVFSSRWSDVSAEEWEHLVLTIDGASKQDDIGATPVPARRPCQSQQYRRRKRLELAQLRTQVAELQATLHSLQTTRGCRSDAIVPVPRQSAVAMAWKRMARHQHAARRNAEAENERLRTALERELREVHKLQMLIRKRCGSDQEWTQLRSKPFFRMTPHGTGIFEKLRRQIDARIVEIDLLLRQVGFTACMLDLEHTRVCSDRPESVECEILFAKVFPFGHEATADVVWSYCGSTPPPASGHTSCTDTSTEMMFRLPTRVRHCDMVIDAHVVMRRSKETTRVVEWYEGAWVLQSSSDTYDGITLRDRGWHVIQELADDPTDGEPSAIVQCCSQLQLATPNVSQPDEVQVLREALITVYLQHLHKSFEAFETSLIEQAVRSHAVTST